MNLIKRLYNVSRTILRTYKDYSSAEIGKIPCHFIFLKTCVHATKQVSDMFLENGGTQSKMKVRGGRSGGRELRWHLRHAQLQVSKPNP